MNPLSTDDTQNDVPAYLSDLIPYRCPICGTNRRFSTVRELRRHLQRDHVFDTCTQRPRARARVFDNMSTGYPDSSTVISTFSRDHDTQFTHNGHLDHKATLNNRHHSQTAFRKLSIPQTSRVHNEVSDFSRLTDNDADRLEIIEREGSPLLRSFKDETALLERELLKAKQIEMSNRALSMQSLLHSDIDTEFKSSLDHLDSNFELKTKPRVVPKAIAVSSSVITTNPLYLSRSNSLIGNPSTVATIAIPFDPFYTNTASGHHVTSNLPQERHSLLREPFTMSHHYQQHIGSYNPNSKAALSAITAPVTSTAGFPRVSTLDLEQLRMSQDSAQLTFDFTDRHGNVSEVVHEATRMGPISSALFQPLRLSPSTGHLTGLPPNDRAAPVLADQSSEINSLYSSDSETNGMGTNNYSAPPVFVPRLDLDDEINRGLSSASSDMSEQPPHVAFHPEPTLGRPIQDFNQRPLEETVRLHHFKSSKLLPKSGIEDLRQSLLKADAATQVAIETTPPRTNTVVSDPSMTKPKDAQLPPRMLDQTEQKHVAVETDRPIKDDVHNQQDQLNQALKQIDMMTSLHARLFEQSKILTAQTEETTDTMQRLLEAKGREIGDLTTRIQSLTHEKNELESSNSSLAETAEQSITAVNKLREAVRSKEQDLQTTQADLHDLKKFIASATEKERAARSRLETFIEDLIGRTEIAESQLHQLQTQSMVSETACSRTSGSKRSKYEQEVANDTEILHSKKHRNRQTEGIDDIHQVSDHNGRYSGYSKQMQVDKKTNGGEALIQQTLDNDSDEVTELSLDFNKAEQSERQMLPPKLSPKKPKRRHKSKQRTDKDVPAWRSGIPYLGQFEPFETASLSSVYNPYQNTKLNAHYEPKAKEKKVNNRFYHRPQTDIQHYGSTDNIYTKTVQSKTNARDAKSKKQSKRALYYRYSREYSLSDDEVEYCISANKTDLQSRSLSSNRYESDIQPMDIDRNDADANSHGKQKRLGNNLVAKSNGQSPKRNSSFNTIKAGQLSENNIVKHHRKHENDVSQSPLNIGSREVTRSSQLRRPTSVGLSRHSSGSESNSEECGIKHINRQTRRKQSHRKHASKSPPYKSNNAVNEKGRVTSRGQEGDKLQRETISERSSRPLSADLLISRTAKQHSPDGNRLGNCVLQDNLSDGANDTLTQSQSGGDLDRLLDENGILWADQDDTLPDVSDSELDRVSPSGSEAIATKTAVATTINQTKPHWIFANKVHAQTQQTVVNMTPDTKQTVTNTSSTNSIALKLNDLHDTTIVTIQSSSNASAANESALKHSSNKLHNRHRSQASITDSKRFRPILSEIGKKGSIASLTDTDLTSGAQEVHQYMTMPPEIDVFGVNETHIYSVDDSERQTSGEQCAMISVTPVESAVIRISDKNSFNMKDNTASLSPSARQLNDTPSIDDRIKMINEKYKVKREEIVKGKGLKNDSTTYLFNNPKNNTRQPSNSAIIHSKYENDLSIKPVFDSNKAKPKNPINSTSSGGKINIPNARTDLQSDEKSPVSKQYSPNNTHDEVFPDTHSQGIDTKEELRKEGISKCESNYSDKQSDSEYIEIQEPENVKSSVDRVAFDVNSPSIFTKSNKLLEQTTKDVQVSESDDDTEHILSNLDRTIGDHCADLSEYSDNEANEKLINHSDEDSNNQQIKTYSADFEKSKSLPSSSIQESLSDRHTETTDHYDRINDSDVDTENYQQFIESDIGDNRSKDNVFSISEEIGEHLDLNLRTNDSIDHTFDDNFVPDINDRQSLRSNSPNYHASIPKSNDICARDGLDNLKSQSDFFLDDHVTNESISRGQLVDQTLSLQEDIVAPSSFAVELQDDSMANNDTSISFLGRPPDSESRDNKDHADIDDTDNETDIDQKVDRFEKGFEYEAFESDDCSFDHQTAHKRYTASSASSQASVEILDCVPANRREETRRRRAALVTIFSYLDLVSLFHVSRVCREWRLVSRSPKLWKVVRMERMTLSPQLLKFLSKRCSKLRILELKDMRPHDAEDTEANNPNEEKFGKLRSRLEGRLEQVLKKAESSLHTITIENCGQLLSPKCMWTASCCCRLLRHVTYLSDCEPINSEVMWALGSGCRDLQTLRVHPLLPNRKTEVFSTRCAQMIGQCFQDLTVLSFGGKHIELSALVFIAKRCQKLHTLELHDMQYISCEVTDECCRAGMHVLTYVTFLATPVPAGALILLRDHCPLLRSIHVQLQCSDHTAVVSTAGMTRPDYTELTEGLRSLESQSGFTGLLTLDLEEPPPAATPSPEVEKSFFQKWFGS